MDVEITRMNGQSFRLSEYNITVRDFSVSGIPMVTNYWSTEGRSGVVDLGAEYGQREITIPFYTKSSDMVKYAHVRDKLFSLITSREPVYIREMRTAKEDAPGTDVFVSGKRYLVRISDITSPEQARVYGFGELLYETVETPFSESVKTTLQLEKSGVTSDWTSDMNLINTDEARKYTQTARTFRIYNAGDVAVHPFENFLNITISGGTGADIRLKNTTTGDEFRYLKAINDKTIVLNKALITVNGLRSYRDTNREFISLAPGWNTFEVNRDVTIKFDFRYYYK